MNLERALAVFEPTLQAWRYEDQDDELDAIADGRKPISMFSCTSELARDPIYIDLVEAAEERGLVVETVPARSWTHILVYAHREAWRVDALVAHWRALDMYEWSYAAEYMASQLLGYSHDETLQWIGNRQRVQRGYASRTVYIVVGQAQYEEIARNPAAALVSSLAWDDAWLLCPLDDQMPTHALAEGQLLRCGIHPRALETLLSITSRTDWLHAPLTDELVRQLNRAIVQGLQRWSPPTWVDLRTDR